MVVRGKAAPSHARKKRNIKIPSYFSHTLTSDQCVTKINLGFSGSLDKDYKDMGPSYSGRVVLEHTPCDVSSSSSILPKTVKITNQRANTPRCLEELPLKSRTCIGTTSSRFYKTTCFRSRSWQRGHPSAQRLAQKPFSSTVTSRRDDARSQITKSASVKPKRSIRIGTSAMLRYGCTVLHNCSRRTRIRTPRGTAIVKSAEF